MAKLPEQPRMTVRIIVSIALLFGLLVVGSLIALLFSGDLEETGANTAVIRIVGPIAGDESGGVFSESYVGSSEIVRQLEEARDDPAIAAVILEINSPGGSAVASDEIAQAVKDLRAQDKIVVAWIRETGASGAYWIASASDHIVANRMSITGSIGVIGSYLEFSEFLDDWNVTYNRLVSGENKDVGDPFTELTPQQRAYLQGKLDRVHLFFIEEVARNRNMSVDRLAPIADGSFYLGVEAAELGLVDELGGKDTAIRYIENRTGTQAVLVTYEPERTFFEELFGTAGRYEPRIADPMRYVGQEVPVPMLR